jgi:putative ABC transport system permease protein
VPKLFVYSLRSLWQRRRTSLAAAFGIALVVFVLSASRMLSLGMRQTMASSGNLDQALVMQHDTWAEHASRMDHSALGRVAAAPGVKRNATGQAMLTGEAVGHILLRDARDKTRIGTVQVRGVSDNVLELRPEARITSGRMLTPGTAEAVIGQGIVGRYDGLTLGGQVRLASKRSVQVVGLFATGGTAHESELWTDLHIAQSALAADGSLSSVTVQLESDGALDSFADAVTADKNVGLSVARESAYFAKVSGGVADVISILGIVETLIFSIGATLGAMVTMHGSVAQRLPEIGVLRALGFSQRHILSAFLLESVALSLAGAVAGATLSLLTPLLDFATMNFATQQEVVFHFAPGAEILLGSVAVGGVLGVFAGILPAARAARITPSQAMRP